MANNLLKKRIKWNFTAGAFLFIITFIIEDRSFGTYFTSWFYGLILIIFGVVYSLRYNLFQPVVILGLGGITLWHFILAEHFIDNIYMLNLLGIDVNANQEDNPFSMLIWFINLLILIVIGTLYLPVLMKSIKFEDSARKIFKNAARFVSGTTDGFTSRPYSAGSIDYSKDQIIGFAHYLSERSVAFPVFEKNGLFLLFSMGRSPVSGGEPTEFSYVNFDYNGTVSVSVSSSDYRKYRDKITFDQLCASIGDVFKRFLSYYIANREAMITSELNTN